MTPLLTVNLLRVLFVTACATIGAMVSMAVQNNAWPGLLLGLVLGGRANRPFAQGMLVAGVLLSYVRAIAGAALRKSPLRFRYFALSIGNHAMGGSTDRLQHIRLSRNDAGDAQ